MSTLCPAEACVFGVDIAFANAGLGPDRELSCQVKRIQLASETWFCHASISLGIPSVWRSKWRRISGFFKNARHGHATAQIWAVGLSGPQTVAGSGGLIRLPEAMR